MKAERHSYEGHQIEIRARGDQAELLIDNVPFEYGRLPDGRFYLADYAYDWTDDLLELARRFVKYRTRADEILRKKRTREGGQDEGRGQGTKED